MTLRITVEKFNAEGTRANVEATCYVTMGDPVDAGLFGESYREWRVEIVDEHGSRITSIRAERDEPNLEVARRALSKAIGVVRYERALG